MSDIERLRKLAGIKEKPVLTEVKPVKKTLAVGTKKSLVESDEGVVESTTEYDLSISTDTFGQYKSKPLEPDFPADMGEKFSKFSSGESNDAIGDGEDGFGKEEGTEQPEDSGTAEKSETKSAPEPKAESKPKDTTEAPKEPAKNFFDDESDDEPKDEKEPEEPKEDDEFSKKVKEAQEYYRIKHFVRSNIKESNDYADAFMAAIKVLAEQAETLIVKYGANLSQMQEKQIAMDVATDLSEGRKTVYEAAKIHGARGTRKGSTYTFEFTDTASALMFTNYLAETCECVSVLSQNRGFIEAKVRDFVEVKKKLDEGWRNVGATNGTSGSNNIEHIRLSADQLKKHKISPPKGGEKYGKCYVFSDGRRKFHVYAGQPEGNAYWVSVRSATNASDFRAMGEIIDYLKS